MISFATVRYKEKPGMRLDRGMIGLVVFDLDGTLVDSSVDIANAANALLEALGGAPLPIAAIVEMVGDGAPLLVRRALAAASLDPDTPDALDRFLALYDSRLLVHTAPYDGMVEALTWIGARMPMSVLTNKPARPTALMLDGLGLRHHFRDVVGGDTAFGRKPEPAGLLHLASAAGVAAGAHADGRGFAGRSWRPRATPARVSASLGTGSGSGSARLISVETSCSSIRRRGWWICCGRSRIGGRQR